MDLTDAAILRVLRVRGADPRPSYADAARELGIDEDTVRARLNGLEESGVIQGWDVFVHPAAFGRTAVRVDVVPTSDAARQAALDTAHGLPGAYMVWDFFRSGIAVALMVADAQELACGAATLAAAAGASPSTFPLPLPPLDGRIDAKDAAILRALRRGPRRPLTELAREAGVPERTLRRRLDALVDKQAAILSVAMDFTKVRGVLPIEGRVPVQDEATRARVLRPIEALPGLVVAFPHGPVVLFSAAVPHLAALDAVEASLREVAGPAVRIEVIRCRTQPRAWVDGALQALVGESR